MKRITFQVFAISAIGLSTGMIYGQNIGVLQQPNNSMQPNGIDVFQTHSQAEQDVLSIALLVAELDVKALSQLSKVPEKQPDPGTFESKDRPVRLFGQVVDPERENDPIRKLQLERLVLIHQTLEHERELQKVQRSVYENYANAVYQRLNAELELAKNTEQKLSALKSAFQAFSQSERDARIRIMVLNNEVPFDDSNADDEPLVKLFREFGQLSEREAIEKLRIELQRSISDEAGHLDMQRRVKMGAVAGEHTTRWLKLRLDNLATDKAAEKEILKSSLEGFLQCERNEEIRFGVIYPLEYLQAQQDVLSVRIRLAELGVPPLEEEVTVQLFGETVDLTKETDPVRKLRLQKLRSIRQEIKTVQNGGAIGYSDYSQAYHKQLAEELQLAENDDQRTFALNKALKAFQDAEQRLAKMKQRLNNEPGTTAPSETPESRLSFPPSTDVISAHPRAQADVLAVRIQIEELKRKPE